MRVSLKGMGLKEFSRLTDTHLEGFDLQSSGLVNFWLTLNSYLIVESLYVVRS